MRLNNLDLLMVTKIEEGSPRKVLIVLMALRIGSTCGPCSGGDYGSVIAHLHVRQMYIKCERFTMVIQMGLLTTFETTKIIVFLFQQSSWQKYQKGERSNNFCFGPLLHLPCTYLHIR